MRGTFLLVLVAARATQNASRVGDIIHGSRLHRAYAAAMRAEPSCARYVRGYPFNIALDHEGGVEGYVDELLARAPPVVWMVQGGSGLGNGLWGWVLAFAQSLLTGRALLVASSHGSLPSDYLCDAIACRFPRVDVGRAERVPGVMFSHGYMASAVRVLTLLPLPLCESGPDPSLTIKDTQPPAPTPLSFGAALAHARQANSQSSGLAPFC